jgi:peptidoglycan/LPS O-acetylase OafA/YrhL
MAHMPINHPFRPFYRIVSGACGLALLLLGALAFGSDGAFGARVNPAGSVLFLVIGALTLVGSVVGRNLGRWIHLTAGVALLVVGMASLALLRSQANLFDFSMTTCIVTFVVGLALLTCGLYEQVGPPEKQEREERFRHGEIADPESHPLGADDVPRAKSS